MFRKVLQYILALFVIILLNFLIPRMMPGDPTDCLLGTNQDAQFNLSPEDRARLLSYYGLDRPVIVQFGHYLANLAALDLGHAVYYKRPVSSLIAERLPWTMLLMGASFFLSTILGVVLGSAAAHRQGAMSDHALTSAVLVFRAIPAFILGMLAIVLFGVILGIFPLGGATSSITRYGSPFSAGADIIWHLLLPVMVLTLEQTAGPFLLMRNSMVAVLGETYVAMARAKGLPERRILHRYEMRNAILPVFTRLGMHAGFMITGAIFIETVFKYPGMGRLIFEAVQFHDYPVIQGVFLVVAVSILAANICVDVLYRYLDPRIRGGSA
jgi:peptide/nickel transport system permease protein